jgi:Lrp/AsnC family leucine-responsive transcriptional regulator
MDAVDRRVLYELDLGSRRPVSAIARRLRLSERTVSYRLEKMLAEGVIEKFITILNTAKLGFTDYKLYIRLSNVSTKEELKILNFLVNHQNVQWLVSCQGNYDLIMAIYGRNIVHFHNVLLGIQKEIGNYISHKDLSITAGLYNFRRSYLIGKNRKAEEFTFYGEEPQRVALGSVDAKILSAISQDARMPTIKIAAKTGVSPEVVKYRLKKLERQNIIQGFRPRINTAKLGLEYYKILLSLRNKTPKVEEKIIRFVHSLQNVVYATKCVASWDFEFECEVEAPAKLQGILSRLRDRFPDNIKDYQSILMIKEYKFDYLPMKEEFASEAFAEAR